MKESEIQCLDRALYAPKPFSPSKASTGTWPCICVNAPEAIYKNGPDLAGGGVDWYPEKKTWACIAPRIESHWHQDGNLTRQILSPMGNVHRGQWNRNWRSWPPWLRVRISRNWGTRTRLRA